MPDSASDPCADAALERALAELLERTAAEDMPTRLRDVAQRLQVALDRRRGSAPALGTAGDEAEEPGAG